MNLLFVHLLNNYTGSPQVLSNILKELSQNEKYKISLLTSNTDGCLSSIKNITYHDNLYRWSNNKSILFFLFLFSEIYIFLFVLFKAHRFDVVYINTLLPFGASIAGALRRKRIIYHIHEHYIHPNILQNIMRFVMHKTAKDIICVSKYISDNIKRKSIIVYNSVSSALELAGKDINGQNIARGKFERRKIMMISGLKKYKGIDNFVSLAKQCPEYLFVLICSSTRKDIEEYFVDTKLTDNINILSQQNDLTTYYFDASIVINLTLPDLCVEALSMTLLEGMQFGTPCIAPDFGGPKEIIINGKNGFLINPYDEKAVIAAIKQIMNTEKAYSNFVQGALETRKRFSIDTLIRKVTILLESR